MFWETKQSLKFSTDCTVLEIAKHIHWSTGETSAELRLNRANELRLQSSTRVKMLDILETFHPKTGGIEKSETFLDDTFNNRGSLAMLFAGLKCIYSNQQLQSSSFHQEALVSTGASRHFKVTMLWDTRLWTNSYPVQMSRPVSVWNINVLCHYTTIVL